MILLLLACVAEPPLPAEHRVQLEDVRLEVADQLVIHAAQATVEDDGAVQATVVQASLAGKAVADEVAPPPLEIDAPRSEWDMRTRTIRFTGGVTAVRGEVTLT